MFSPVSVMQKDKKKKSSTTEKTCSEGSVRNVFDLSTRYGLLLSF